jgi:hypothetical protein
MCALCIVVPWCLLLLLLLLLPLLLPWQHLSVSCFMHCTVATSQQQPTQTLCHLLQGCGNINRCHQHPLSDPKA